MDDQTTLEVISNDRNDCNKFLDKIANNVKIIN